MSAPAIICRLYTLQEDNLNDSEMLSYHSASLRLSGTDVVNGHGPTRQHFSIEVVMNYLSALVNFVRATRNLESGYKNDKADWGYSFYICHSYVR